MSNILSKVREYIGNFANNRNLKPGYFTLVLIYTGFIAITSLERVFVSTLFIRITQSNSTSFIYNIIVFTFCSISMFVSVFLLRIKSASFTFKLSLLFYITMYFMFLIFFENIVDFMPYIAIASGIASGFFATSYNVLLCEFTMDNSRDLGISILNIFGGAISLTVPIIAGYVIVFLDGLSGYIAVFAFAFIVSVYTMLISTKLKGVSKQNRKLNFKGLFCAFKSNITYTFCLLAVYIKCIREGILSFLVSVILFQIITNEAVVGLNSFFTGIGIILGAWLYGKFITPNRRLASICLSVSIMSIITIFLLFNTTPMLIILFSLANAICNQFINSPSFSIVSKVVMETKQTTQLFAEYNTIRGVFVALGRVSGIVFALLLPEKTIYYILMIFIITSIQYIVNILCYFILKRHHTYIKQVKTQV